MYIKILEIDINKTLKFAGCIQTKVDEMIEMASIEYPDNETFKKLVETRNEMLLKAFRPGKVCDVLELENDVQSDEHRNNEQELDENRLHSTYEFFRSQLSPNSQSVLNTIMETPEDGLVSNLVENVGGTGNAKENSGNNNDGDNSGLNVCMILNEGTYTNLNEGVKEIEKDNKKSVNDDIRRTLSQVVKDLQRETGGKKRMVDGGEDTMVGGDEHTPMLGDTQLKIRNAGGKEEAVQTTNTSRIEQDYQCDFTPSNFNMLSQNSSSQNNPKTGMANKSTPQSVQPIQAERTGVQNNEDGDQNKSTNEKAQKDKNVRKRRITSFRLILSFKYPTSTIVYAQYDDKVDLTLHKLLQGHIIMLELSIFSDFLAVMFIIHHFIGDPKTTTYNI
nr:hypothetical protein [Tanacetum cinerariifolium]